LNRSRTLLTIAYLALIVLQPAWHALAPSPLGNESWILAVVAVVPLLLPLRGLLAGSLRSMTWAGYLLMLYLVVGVMEAWANPPQRIPALTQVLLVVLFIGSVLVFSRQVPRNQEETDR
jgi:uncharacterized membrane protein